MTPILGAWADRHHDLALRALDVWCAIPDGDDVFGRTLAAFDGALRPHMEVEEAHLFPAWSGLVQPPNGTVAVLSADHARLRALVAELGRSTLPVLRATAAATLIDVLHHHDLRERQGLFPGLDAAVPEDLRRSWVADAGHRERDVPPRATSATPRRGPASSDVREVIATDAPADGVDCGPTPDHPRGARRVAAWRAAHAQVLSATDARSRREAALGWWGAQRLLAIVRAVSPGGATGTGTLPPTGGSSGTAPSPRR